MGLAFPETDRVAFSSERAREAQACVCEIRGAIAPDENLQRQMKACRRKQLLLWDFIWASVWKMSRMAWTCFFLMWLMKMHFRWSLWSLNLRLGALKPCSSDSAASPVMTVRNTAGASVSDGETLSTVGSCEGKVSWRTGFFCCTSLNNTDVHCTAPDNSLQLHTALLTSGERAWLYQTRKPRLLRSLVQWRTPADLILELCLHQSLDDAVLIRHSSITNVENYCFKLLGKTY